MAYASSTLSMHTTSTFLLLQISQIIAYLHIPADRIFHPDTATDGAKKQKLLLMLQECDEQEAAEILPAIEYLLALIHKRGNSNE